jgi:hypothetical protein
MVKLIQHCRCNTCNATLAFDLSEYDRNNLPQINCPQCGLPTQLYATEPPAQQLDEESEKRLAQLYFESPAPKTPPASEPTESRPDYKSEPNMAQAWGWTWRVMVCLLLVGFVVGIIFGIVSCIQQEANSPDPAHWLSH